MCHSNPFKARSKQWWSSPYGTCEISTANVFHGLTTLTEHADRLITWILELDACKLTSFTDVCVTHNNRHVKTQTHWLIELFDKQFVVRGGHGTLRHIAFLYIIIIIIIRSHSRQTSVTSTQSRCVHDGDLWQRAMGWSVDHTAYHRNTPVTGVLRYRYIEKL